jgi:hypothetical protein
MARRRMLKSLTPGPRAQVGLPGMAPSIRSGRDRREAARALTTRQTHRAPASVVDAGARTSGSVRPQGFTAPVVRYRTFAGVALSLGSAARNAP